MAVKEIAEFSKEYKEMLQLEIDEIRYKHQYDESLEAMVCCIECENLPHTVTSNDILRRQCLFIHPLYVIQPQVVITEERCDDCKYNSATVKAHTKPFNEIDSETEW